MENSRQCKLSYSEQKALGSCSSVELKEAGGGTPRDLGLGVEVCSMFQRGEVRCMCLSPDLGTCSVCCVIPQPRKAVKTSKRPSSLLQAPHHCLFSPSPSWPAPPIHTVLQFLLHSPGDVLLHHTQGHGGLYLPRGHQHLDQCPKQHWTSVQKSPCYASPPPDSSQVSPP